MTRTAEYSIQGFIYEFNKCLFEILSSEVDREIRVNGIIEDIDIISNQTIDAIQCKYHESVTNYTLSDVYKPILLMMDQYVKDPTQNVTFKLYAYFPNEKLGKKILTKNDLDTILKSTNVKLRSIISRVKGNIDLDSFLSIFTFEIGDKLDDLQEKTRKALEKEEFSKQDVEEIIFPNAIQKISELAICHNPDDRILNKKTLIQHLRLTKKTAITRWTRELKNYHTLLRIRKEQLKSGLNKNSRYRYLILDSKQLQDFNLNIVKFINDFIITYNSKIKLHDKTPIFCIDCDENLFSDLLIRIHKKGITYETGLISDYFDEQKFLRHPKRIIKDDWIEFSLRICRYTEETIRAMNNIKCDDLFIVSKAKYNELERIDLNEELLDISQFNELRYLLSITKTLD